MKLSENTYRAAIALCLLVGEITAPAASRTFQSLTIAPASTNIMAGGIVSATVALTTKASSGSTASGQITNSVSIFPSAAGMTAAIDPVSYVIGTSQTSNSVLTVTTSANVSPN